jgi:hypothetical protein
MTERQREVRMGHLKSGMNARYVHVPDQALIAAINKIPYRDYDYATNYHEWAQSGYGSHSEETPTFLERAEVA